MANGVMLLSTHNWNIVGTAIYEIVFKNQVLPITYVLLVQSFAVS